MLLISPNNLLQFHLYFKEGQLSYELQWHKSTIISNSKLGFFIKDKEELSLKKVELESEDTENKLWKPVWGHDNSILDLHHKQLYSIKGICSDTNEAFEFKLEVKLFNEGVAFRYIFPELDDGSSKEIVLLREKTEFNFEGDLLCSITQGERAPEKESTISNCDWSHKAPSNLPVILRKQSSFAVALFESSPLNVSQMRIMPSKSSPNGLQASIEPSTLTDSKQMPWRIILIAPHAGNFLASTLALNLAEPTTLKDVSWVIPGKSTWDWRVQGVSVDDFTYRVNTQSMKRLVDFSVSQGLNYFLADADWSLGAEGKPLDDARDVNIREVIRYAKDRGIGTFLYYDLKYVNVDVSELDFELVAKTFSEMGAVGVKFGFLGIVGPRLSGQAKSKKTLEIINICAKYKLMINFHDNPIPMPGIERTYPHCLSREYCHSQQDCRRGYDSGEFIRMAYINQLLGPMDQANGVFAIKDNVLRENGAKNGIASTLASEVARVVITFSGFVTLPDTPEVYLEKNDLFDFIRKIPDCWDESLFLQGEFGEYIIIGRRKGSSWFVGATGDKEKREMKLQLNFLDDGKYTAYIAEDADDTHFKERPESYRVRTEKVQKQKILSFVIAPGGGFCIRFERDQL